MKKAGLYIRVSTLEQAQEGYSIGEQKDRLISFCKAHDWFIADVYVDGGYTGSNLDRPGIQKLISEISKLDVVLVYKLDRLSRTQRDTIHLIEDVFLPNGVDFMSMQESFDTSSPFGRAMIGMLSVFAQLEREQIKERTMMGKLARAREGLYHGGGSKPIGYDYIDGKLSINKYEAIQIRQIYKWYIDGMGTQKIAEKLLEDGYTNRYSSWSDPKSRASGITRIISNDIYTGTLRFGDVVVENAHDAIISREDYDKANTIRRKRHEIWGNTAYISKYLLVGFAFCARCEARYHVKHNYKDYKYYECYSRAQTVKKMAKADKCDNDNWRLESLETRVASEIEKLFISPKYFESLVKEHERQHNNQKRPLNETDILKDKIADLDKQISKLMDLFQADSIPADILSTRIDKIYREKLEFTEQLNRLEPQTPKKDFDVEGVSGMLSDLATVWKNADHSEKRLVLEALINKIMLDGDTVKIEWSFLE